MYFNIYVIYHSDIYRKKHIDNIINKLFYQPHIENIYSNLHKKDVTDMSSIYNLSSNEVTEVLDHYHIWNKIALTNSNNNEINLIIDDSVDLNTRTFNVHQIIQYINNIVDELFNNKTCIDWNILFLYEQNFNKDFNEIQITENIVSPNDKRISYKTYFINNYTAKLLNNIKSINTNISQFFTNLLHKNNYSFNYCWQLFAIKKPIFIDDLKNQDITNYIYYYNNIEKPFSINIQTLQQNIISKYLTIFFFVKRYKEYHYFKRIYNYLNSFGLHIIPIFYDDNSNKYKLFLNEFNNLYSECKDNHYIIISSTIHIIINISIDNLLNCYDQLKVDIIYSHNFDNKCNFIENLWLNKISITKYNHISNIINNKLIDNISVIYNNNNDFFFNIENTNPNIKLKYDNEIKYFYYTDISNIYTYPLFIYSLKHNILLDDILNIYPFRGKIIHNTSYSSKFYKSNKLLILMFINTHFYNILYNNLDKWINNYKNRFILPTSINDIDFILYSDDISLYHTISNKFKVKIDYICDFRKYYISTLQYADTIYRFVLVTTVYHDITNIYTLFDLMYTNQPIIVPLICGNKYGKKTISLSGVIDRLLNRSELGLWVIPYMKETYLLNANVYSEIILAMTIYPQYKNETFDDYLIRCIKLYNIPIYCSNIRIYGTDNRI